MLASLQREQQQQQQQQEQSPRSPRSPLPYNNNRMPWRHLSGLPPPPFSSSCFYGHDELPQVSRREKILQIIDSVLTIVNSDDFDDDNFDQEGQPRRRDQDYDDDDQDHHFLSSSPPFQ